jgi:hypothetical protein
MEQKIIDRPVQSMNAEPVTSGRESLAGQQTKTVQETRSLRPPTARVTSKRESLAGNQIATITYAIADIRSNQFIPNCD